MEEMEGMEGMEGIAAARRTCDRLAVVAPNVRDRLT
jgi:hypothetical protein